MKIEIFLRALAHRTITYKDFNNNLDLSDIRLFKPGEALSNRSTIYVTNPKEVSLLSPQNIEHHIFLLPGNPPENVTLKNNQFWIEDAGDTEEIMNLAQQITHLYEIHMENTIQLYKYFLETQDLGLLIVFAGKLFQNPLAYFDGGTEPALVSDDELIKQATSSTMLQRASLDTINAEPEAGKNFRELTYKLLTEKKAFFWQLEHETPRLLCRIGEDNSHLTLMQYTRNLIYTDYLLLETLASIITTFLRQKEGASIGNLRLKFIDHCMNACMTEENQLLQEVKTVGWNFAGDLQIILIEPDTAKKSRLYTQFLKLYMNEFDEYSHIISRAQYVVCVITRRIDQTLLKIIKRFLERNHLKGSVSSVFHKLSEMKYAYTQAEHLLILGKDFFPDRFLYDPLSLENELILYMLEENHLLASYCLEELDALIEYDRLHHSHYADFIATYIQNNQSIVQTASALGVHRNTMTKRLHKCEEIMGISLEDPAICHRLDTTLQVQSYMQKRGLTERRI